MKLIDADTLPVNYINSIVEQIGPKGEITSRRTNTWAVILKNDIDDTEGKDEEFIKVVRCKDCYHYDKGENEVDAWSWCCYNAHNTQEEDFCSWGERREE